MSSGAFLSSIIQYSDAASQERHKECDSSWYAPSLRFCLLGSPEITLLPLAHSALGFFPSEMKCPRPRQIFLLCGGQNQIIYRFHGIIDIHKLLL